MNEQSTSDKTAFRTKDLDQAAFIWCQEGVRLMRAQAMRDKGTTIFFLFELLMSEDQLRDLQIKYANCETLVEPQLYVSKQSNLRDLLHNALSTARQGDKPDE